MSYRSLSRPLASVVAIAHTTTNSVMAISKLAIRCHLDMSQPGLWWRSGMLLLASRLATGLHWKLVCRVTTVGRASEVDITFAVG